jgi:hypothetical protein
VDIKEAIQLKGARLQILIKQDTPLGQYNDALYYTPDEVAVIDEKAIQEAADKRVNNWVAFVDAQSKLPPVPPSKEQLKESAEQQADSIAVLTNQLIAASPTKEELLAVQEKLKVAMDALSAATAADVKP